MPAFVLSRSGESEGEGYRSSLSGLLMDGPDRFGGMKSPPREPFQFQFFPDDILIEEMCAADELFFHGRLLPSNPFPKKEARPPPPQPQPQPAARKSSSCPSATGNLQHHHLHTRSKSMSRIERRKLDGAADYVSLKKSASADSATSRQPKWYLLVLGSRTVPPAMEMRDIRNRLRRPRHPAPLTPTATPARPGPWNPLQLLSCKNSGIAGSAVAPTRLVSRGAS